MNELTESDLLTFEEEVAVEFATGSIKSPVHLGGGNEKNLLEIFKTIKPGEWVLVGWRSHFHCLLAGVPREELKTAIRAGRSVSLCFPKHKILCSGIVGGIAPIAVGLAWAIKRRGEAGTVNCFVGDMSAEAGIVHESMKYAARNQLPVRWVIEDNSLSVMTPTQKSWGEHGDVREVTRYKYELTRPHSGIGRWVRF